MEITMDEALMRHSPPTVTSAWRRLPAVMRHWHARSRLRRDIAHLDDRLLDDVGLDPRDLGLSERLMRRYGAGDGIWTAKGGQ
jgi:uncharacterized protein YjiS (DUF1127 family)